MNKTAYILIVAGLIIGVSLASSYQLKCLHPSINCSEIKTFLNTIPPQYLDGIKGISIYKNIELKGSKSGLENCGLYYTSGIIKISADCEYKNVIYHELKHHYCVTQFKEGGHNKCFNTKIGLGKF